MRLFLTSALALALLATNAAGQAPPPADSTTGEAVFAVSGRGWGHGVGLSQWGAYGQAKAGRTYEQILAHYYFGTKLGRASKSEVRVLLAEGKRALTVQSPAPFRVQDAAGVVTKLPAGALILTPQLKLPNAVKPSAGPLVVLPGKEPLSLDGRPYRGKLEIAAVGGYLRVVNYVGLESYIAGVVADEMPSTWPIEALKAQAVAARTFALEEHPQGQAVRSLLGRQEPGLRRRRVRGGLGDEGDPGDRRPGRDVRRPARSPRSTSRAPVARRRALPMSSERRSRTSCRAPIHGTRHRRTIAGGRCSWARGRSSRSSASTARVLDASAVPTPSGRIRSLTLKTASGTTSVPSSLVRTALGLRSTWINVGVLRLDRPKGTVEFGASLQIGGVARNVVAPQLQSSTNGKTWTDLGPLERAADGTFSTAVSPTKTTSYRIEAGWSAAQPASRVTSQVLLVRVGPKVRLSKPVEPGVLSGTVRPRLGAIVHVERLRGGSWVHVGETLADGSGAFRIEAQVVPGTYRARTSPIAGFVEGLSPLVAVG